MCWFGDVRCLGEEDRPGVVADGARQDVGIPSRALHHKLTCQLGVPCFRFARVLQFLHFRTPRKFSIFFGTLRVFSHAQATNSGPAPQCRGGNQHFLREPYAKGFTSPFQASWLLRIFGVFSFARFLKFCRFHFRCRFRFRFFVAKVVRTPASIATHHGAKHAPFFNFASTRGIEGEKTSTSANVSEGDSIGDITVLWGQGKKVAGHLFWAGSVETNPP